MFPKVAFGCLALALLLHLIAMGAPQWARSDLNKMDRKEHIGLWRYCTYPYGGGEACGDFVDIIVGGMIESLMYELCLLIYNFYADWLKAAQAFMIFGMLGLIGAVAVVAIIAFVPDFEGDNRILGAGVAVTGAAGASLPKPRSFVIIRHYFSSVYHDRCGFFWSTVSRVLLNS